MKKILLLIGLTVMFLTPAYADCNCTGREIIKEIKQTFPSYEKDSLLEDLLSSYGAKSIVTNKVTDSREFKEAVKKYIEYNCRIENNKITCR